MPSPFRFLRAGPPPPKVALLPDSAFFVRSIPLAAGATPEEATTQIELALEAASPFPLAQLYYGWYWQPGSPHALAFAAYRRRFTTDQAAAWAGSEVVLPAFATALGLEAEPSTTLLLNHPDAITAVHWAGGPVPSGVLTRAVDPAATEEERARIRAELVHHFGGSRKVLDFAGEPAPEPARSDREIVFRIGDCASRLPAPVLASADVRDKAELAALRGARRRDVLLWHVTVGFAASLALLAAGEFALVGGRMWQRVREQQLAKQKPLVERITRIHEYTNKIEELATKRLRPLEMMTQLTGVDLERKPPEIQFTRMQADQSKGLYTIFVEGRTSNPAQVNAYEATLRKLPSIEKVDAPILQLRGDQTQFSLTAVFKPEALASLETGKPPPP
ncbi:MAG: hypothetical protein FJ399_08290 [Verrucomicrobia bacterium]|nr:hypothetical protein [Verrucomicrobiota bacterium]